MSTTTTVPSTTDALRGRVTKVRVFIDRAAITRSRTLERPEREVVFAPLPVDTDPATLRARAELRGAATPVRVSGVVWTVMYADRASERRDQVRDELLAAEAERLAIDDEEANESRTAGLLGDYARITTATLSREWLDKEPLFDAWGRTLDHLRARHAELAGRRAARKSKRQELQTKIADLLEEQLRLGHPEQLGYRVSVALELPAEAKGPLDVELTYITKKAQWMPVYDARHVPAAGSTPERVHLTAVALVRQSTGEDWEDVTLVATTARPPLSEPPPELVQLLVSGYQGGAEREVVLTVRADARLAGAGAAPAPEQELTVELEAPGKVSVPASNRPVRVELFASELPARARLEVAPRERPVAMLVAELENRTGRVLLPGRVNIFRGPNFSGQAGLGFITPGERFRLPLGTDASLRIKREVKAEPEKKATLTGAVTHAFESRTVVENVSGAAVEVVLRDRVPVSRSEEVTVKVTDVDRAMELHAETGLGTLALTVAPHSKREVNLAYKITAPRGFRVTPPRVL